MNRNDEPQPTAAITQRRQPHPHRRVLCGRHRGHRPPPACASRGCGTLTAGAASSGWARRARNTAASTPPRLECQQCGLDCHAARPVLSQAASRGDDPVARDEQRDGVVSARGSRRPHCTGPPCRRSHFLIRLRFAWHDVSGGLPHLLKEGAAFLAHRNRGDRVAVTVHPCLDGRAHVREGAVRPPLVAQLRRQMCGNHVHGLETCRTHHAIVAGEDVKVSHRCLVPLVREDRTHDARLRRTGRIPAGPRMLARGTTSRRAPSKRTAPVSVGRGPNPLANLRRSGPGPARLRARSELLAHGSAGVHPAF